MMKFTIGSDITQNVGKAINYEWIETNGLGGYASSTIVGINTRRYHGLLVAATNPPAGRKVLLSKLDEIIEIDETRYELGCNQYPGTIHPHGFQYLKKFEKEMFPRFEYQVPGIIVRKTVVAVHGENTTLLLYEIIKSSKAFHLYLQPLIAARDFHSLAKANDKIRTEANFREDILTLAAYDGISNIYLKLPGAEFISQPQWYYNFEYDMERHRGLDYQEDLFSYGFFKLSVQADSAVAVIISDRDPQGKDAIKLFESEKRRRRELLKKLPQRDHITETLALAADQFVVRRAESNRTIIAGYHWFADWGRDAMIALPGLSLATRRFQDARNIIQTYADYIDKGMLPNRFPDEGEVPEYNTVDAALWFYIAIYKYFIYTGDFNFIRKKLLTSLREIIEWYIKGTRYHIHMDKDGLLSAGLAGVQLTWMDAKIGEWVVTPRLGKAVEINALWYNVLMIFADILNRTGEKQQSESYFQLAKKVKKSFNQLFWDINLGYLYDYIDGNYKDTSLRPNQIFGLSLPFTLLSVEKAKKILKIIEKKLYKPIGLRSLSPDDPNYRPTYGGDQYSRDSAYHQGTVWSWLLGPYITAVVRYGGKTGKKKAKKVIQNILPHLSEAGIGTVSEIFDAEAPYAPRGTIAQAWSVAELFRAYFEDIVSIN